MAAEFYRCQATRRHRMFAQDNAPADWTAPNSAYWSMCWDIVHLLCDDCGTWRHIAIDYEGGVLASKYVHPDGYLMDEGQERPTMGHWYVKAAEDVQERRRKREEMRKKRKARKVA